MEGRLWSTDWRGCKIHGMKPEDPKLCRQVFQHPGQWNYSQPLCVNMTGHQKYVEVKHEATPGVVKFATAAYKLEEKYGFTCALNQMLRASMACSSNPFNSQRIDDMVEGMAHPNYPREVGNPSATCVADVTPVCSLGNRSSSTWFMLPKVKGCDVVFQLIAGVNLASVFDPNKPEHELDALGLGGVGAPFNKLSLDDRTQLSTLQPASLRSAVALIREESYCPNGLVAEGVSPCSKNGFGLLPRMAWNLSNPFTLTVRKAYQSFFPGECCPLCEPTASCMQWSAKNYKNALYSLQASAEPFNSESASLPIFRVAGQGNRVFGAVEFRRDSPLLRDVNFIGPLLRKPGDVAANYAQALYRVQRMIEMVAVLGPQLNGQHVAMGPLYPSPGS